MELLPNAGNARALRVVERDLRSPGEVGQVHDRRGEEEQRDPDEKVQSAGLGGWDEDHVDREHEERQPGEHERFAPAHAQLRPIAGDPDHGIRDGVAETRDEEDRADQAEWHAQLRIRGGNPDGQREADHRERHEHRAVGQHAREGEGRAGLRRRFGRHLCLLLACWLRGH